MMIKKLTVLFLITINLSVFGQYEYGLKLNGGLSRVSNSLSSTFDELSVRYATSWHGGLFFNFHIKGKSSLGTELLFLHIGGREILESDLHGVNGEDYGHVKHIDNDHLYYLALPLAYRVDFERIGFGVGIQLSYFLKGVTKYKIKGIVEDENIVQKGKNHFRVSDFDYGPMARLMYRLTKKISIEGVFYFGFKSIVDGNNTYFELKKRNQQITVGVRYTLWSKQLIQDNKNNL